MKRSRVICLTKARLRLFPRSELQDLLVKHTAALISCEELIAHGDEDRQLRNDRATLEHNKRLLTAELSRFAA